jgi:hypothetical protein
MAPAMLDACRDWGWKAAAYPSGKDDRQYPHLMVEGQPIYLMSADAAERIAGFEVGHIWVDEAARVCEVPDDPRRDAPTQIRSRLRHKGARSLHLLATTTPEGTDTWIQRDWIDKRLPDHRLYQTKTTDNPALPAGYIDALKAAYGAELAQQYIDGVAVNYAANRAHPTFTTANVAKLAWQHAPVHIGCDYNVSPMCWVAAQVIGDCLHVVDELVIEDFAQVDTAVHAAHAKGWSKYGKVIFHPDKASKARSTVGDPEFTVMQRTATGLGWQATGDPYGVNPPVNARVNNLSRLILDANGKRRLRVNETCTRLIHELQTTARTGSGYDPGKQGKAGHILDSLGYLAWDCFQPNAQASVAKVSF